VKDLADRVLLLAVEGRSVIDIAAALDTGSEIVEASW
jgi:hypothetical protein